jgi:hypothetical protein
LRKRKKEISYNLWNVKQLEKAVRYRPKKSLQKEQIPKSFEPTPEARMRRDLKVVLRPDWHSWLMNATVQEVLDNTARQIALLSPIAIWNEKNSGFHKLEFKVRCMEDLEQVKAAFRSLDHIPVK